jgi:hypothetical protein
VIPINSFILVRETETKKSNFYILLYIFHNPFFTRHHLKMHLSILIALVLATLAAAGPVVKVDMDAMRRSEYGRDSGPSSGDGH